MDKPQQDKTKWKEVISQPDSITTRKAKSDPDAPGCQGQVFGL